MTRLMDIYWKERPRMEQALEECKSLKSAVDCLLRGMEQVRLEMCSAIPDREARRQADRLFEATREAVRCLLAVNGAEVRVLADRQAIRTPRDKAVALLPAAAMVIGAALTGWLLLEDMLTASVLAAVLTAIAWLETQVVYRRRMAVEAKPRLDRYELLRCMDRLMESIQASLDAMKQEEKPDFSSGGADR